MRKAILTTTLLLAASTVSAGFDFTRSTTVRDDLGGQFQMDATGTLGEDGSTRVAAGRFVQFHPRNDTSSVLDGTLTREALRDGELVTVTYDGALTLAMATTDSAGAPRTLTINFNDLMVERAEEGLTVSGQVTVNGRTVDATALPRPIKAILLRALRLFRV